MNDKGGGVLVCCKAFRFVCASTQLIFAEHKTVLKVVTNEKGEAAGKVVTIIC